MGLYLKYCGNRSYEDYLLVRDSSATHVGFIFFNESKRYVSPESVASWLLDSPANQKIAGVFVNPEMDDLKACIELLSLDVVQLHGTEKPSFIKELRASYKGEIWKVIHHGDEALKSMNDYAGLVDAFLIDSKVAGAWGGTGQAFDWGFVPFYIEEAHRLGLPCVVAGGIHSENVASLMELHPDGIDLASGIEENEQKSDQRIQALERKVVPNK